MLVHQVGSGLSSHGGPSYTVPALCRTLSAQGVDIVLHALAPSVVEPNGLYQFRAHPASRFIPRLGLSGSMRRSLAHAARDADVIHSHLLWMMPNMYPGWVIKKAARSRARLVMSPRGTLDPWEYQSHKLQKRIAWFAGQRLNLQMSAVLHATAPMECAHFRALGLKAPVAVIPNGVDLPDLAAFRLEPKSRRRLLYFGRIARKKGVDLLLRAWRNVQDCRPDWELQIAGDPNGDYLQRMQRLAAELGVRRVTFICPAAAEQKWQLYRNADLYVLATRGDNWAVSVSDALSFAVPAIVSKEAPWEGLRTHAAGWWIDLSVEALTECLRDALNQESDTLAAMGRRGREWMAREFSWETVGIQMKATYQWILSGGERPSWVVA
jgi:glycosyltransferase involved in cell wall biosynthesis